jgi:hypothetical protein
MDERVLKWEILVGYVSLLRGGIASGWEDSDGAAAHGVQVVFASMSRLRTEQNLCIACSVYAVSTAAEARSRDACQRLLSDLCGCTS